MWWGIVPTAIAKAAANAAAAANLHHIEVHQQW